MGTLRRWCYLANPGILVLRNSFLWILGPNVHSLGIINCHFSLRVTSCGTTPSDPQFRSIVFPLQGIRNFHLLGLYYVLPALDAFIHPTSFSLHIEGMLQIPFLE